VYVRYSQSNDWMVASVAKEIGCCHYDVTMSMGSIRRFHAKQMHLRIAQLTGADLTAFA
jgi:hypothetical protein